MPDLILHGASGFVGKHFLNKLIAEKISVTVIARSKSILPNHDLISRINYQNNISEIKADQIKCTNPVFIDFAWKGVFGTERNSPDQAAINIPMVEASIELASECNAKHWIGFGSQAEYGNRENSISETDACLPSTEYGKAKLFCSKKSAELCAEKSIQHSWLRLFSVYGPEDRHEWLIPYLIQNMLDGKEINVTKGEQKWDYLYIDDLSNMLMKLIQTSGIGIANLGSGKAIQVKEIIHTIHKLTESNSQINFGAVPYRDDQVMHMQANISKLSTHLDWHPIVEMEEGLSNCVRSIQKNKSERV